MQGGRPLYESSVTRGLGAVVEEEKGSRDAQEYNGETFSLVGVAGVERTAEYKRYRDWVIEHGVASYDGKPKRFVEAIEDEVFFSK